MVAESNAMLLTHFPNKTTGECSVSGLGFGVQPLDNGRLAKKGLEGKFHPKSLSGLLHLVFLLELLPWRKLQLYRLACQPRLAVCCR